MLLSSAVAEAGENRAAFADTHAEVETRLRRWIVRGQADGSIRSGIDPGSAALMVGCLMFGMSMQLLVDNSVEFAPLQQASLTILRAGLEIRLDRPRV